MRTLLLGRPSVFYLRHLEPSQAYLGVVSQKGFWLFIWGQSSSYKTATADFPEIKPDILLMLCCCAYHYYTTSFHQVWTQVLDMFKSCLWSIRGLWCWEPSTITLDISLNTFCWSAIMRQQLIILSNHHHHNNWKI